MQERVHRRHDAHSRAGQLRPHRPQRRARQILTRDSAYGLDLYVDLDAFDEVLLYYRGASSKRDQRRRWQKFYLKEEFDIPIFQRLFLLFKLKPFDVRVREIMQSEKLNRREAEKVVKRQRASMPPEVHEDNIYMKLFKNIPRERHRDGLSQHAGALPASRQAVARGDGERRPRARRVRRGGQDRAAGDATRSPPLGALVGLGGVAFRQATNFMNQKQRYMVVMAQNLYFHAMADNRGVMLKLAARAAEEDIKEEMLLYSVLAKERARRQDLPDIDVAIEQYLTASFGVSVDFDIPDALRRLIADGIVTERADGTLTTMPPGEAALHIDQKWDLFLDELPEPISAEGLEFEGNAPATRGMITAARARAHPL